MNLVPETHLYAMFIMFPSSSSSVESPTPDLKEREEGFVSSEGRGGDDQRSGYYAPVRIWHPYRTPQSQNQL
jgi:hypothetical protein